MQILNDAVIKEARRTVTTSHTFWLGIRDSDSNNHWQYVSSHQKVSWTNWGPGMPDNSDGLKIVLILGCPALSNGMMDVAHILTPLFVN